jgi:hypothetical protein
MAGMMHGVYCGPELRLKDLGALLLQDPDHEDGYLAQFDAMYTGFGQNLKRLKEAHGWHPFPKGLFMDVHILGEE